MPNDDLHKPLKAINETIARLREDVQTLTGEIKKIKTSITEAAQTIRDAIQENIQAQAELKLMEHVMEVKSIKPQIEAEHKQIRAERDELNERLQNINERYQRKHTELDQKARDRIRNLGSHIFEIDEQQFEAGIEDPFADQVTTAWQTLQAHNADIGEQRTEVLQETANETKRTIQNYIDRQEQLVANIENHQLDHSARGLPSDTSASLQVPYYVVEYEHDGVRKRESVIPSELHTKDSDWYRASLSPHQGVDRLMRDISGVDDPAMTTTLSTGTLCSVSEQYGNSSLLGLSYAEAVAEAIDDGVKVHHEVSD